MNEIINAECVQYMKKYVDNNSIDLTITSPPYDDLRLYNGYEFNANAVLEQLYRVRKPGGVVVWVVGDKVKNGSESGTSFRQVLSAMHIGFRLHDTMIYEKDSISFPDKTRYYQIFEYMFILSKGKPKTVNLISDRKNKWYDGRKHIKGHYRESDGTIKRHNKQNLLKEYGVRYNIWRIPTGCNKSAKNKIAYNHPAIFPEKLAKDHILTWSNEGDIVFDPMCGSGTVPLMAKLENRNYLGLDISQEYVEDICMKRIDAN